MTTQEILDHAKHFHEQLKEFEARANQDVTGLSLSGLQAQVIDFLRNVAGPRNAFTETAEKASGALWYHSAQLAAIMEGYIQYIERGLAGQVSPERKAKLDMVSDLLGQAAQLLEDKNVHPAAPVVIIGATLEEFLRTWVEGEVLSMGNRKAALESYSTALREAELITKQDAKDITSWGGLRNHAAHGEWDEVKDRQRIALMLEGVNLFMRKYSQ